MLRVITDDLAELAIRVAAWRATAFPDVPANAHALKLEQEARELAAEPTDIEEGADCLIAFLAHLALNGLALEDAVAAAFAKLEIIKGYAWNIDERGVGQSIKGNL